MRVCTLLMTHLLSDTGLGILSWRGHETLVPVLESLRGTEDIFGERVIYFNEITDEDRRIASEFGFAAFGSSENMGIYGGFRGLAESMKSRYVLLIENDMCLIESLSVVSSQVSGARSLLSSGRIRVAWFHHLRRPGYIMDFDLFNFLSSDPRETSCVPHEDLTSRYIDTFMDYYPSPGSSLWTRFMCWSRRYRRPAKAATRIGLSPYLLTRPDEIFDEIERDEESGFFLMPCRCRMWTNLSFMLERDFFIDVLLSRVEEVESDIRVSNSKTIEIELNGPWWSGQDWTIGVGCPGLFSHDRRGYRGH